MEWHLPHQPRTVGSEQARELLFGSGVPDGEPHYTPVVELRAFLIQAAQDALVWTNDAAGLTRRSLRRVGSSGPIDDRSWQDLSTLVDNAHQRLAQAEQHLAQRNVTRPFRVVLMGKTKSGKSTLFEYLSRGDGTRIGDGRQRYTRDICERGVGPLGIEIVDTPGVGAMDGEEDVRLAFTQVPDSDLILWVTTDQATQEETGEALERLADLGKPILVALNCLADMGEELNLLDLLEVPDQIFGGDALDNLTMLNRYLARAGGGYINAVRVHAQAAQRAGSGEYPEDIARTLLTHSRIESLVEALRLECHRSERPGRITSMFDFLRVELLESASSIDQAAQTIDGVLAAVRGSLNEFHRRARRRISDAHNELKTFVASAVAERERWVETVDVGQSTKAINEAWRRVVQRLSDSVEERVARINDRLVEDLHVIAADVAADWSDFEPGRFSNLGHRAGLWGNRALKIGGRIGSSLGAGALGLKLGVVIGSFLGPPGSAIGGGIGLVVGAALGFLASLFGLDHLIDWLSDHVFSNQERIHRRRREQLHEQLDPILRKVREQLGRLTEDVNKKWIGALVTAHELEILTLTPLEHASQGLTRVTAKLDAVSARLDTELARELLRCFGRHRAADQVDRASRWRGAGMAVDVHQPSFTELVLFPLDGSMGPIIPTSAKAAPNASALQIVRSLSSGRLTVTRSDTTCLSVRLSSQTPPGVIEAWQALIRIHTGIELQVLDPEEGVVQ